MSVLDELEGKLAELEQRLAELVARLEGLGSFEETLRDTRSGIGDASRSVAKLATVTESSVTSLQGALAGFREAVEVLKRSDPARTIEAMARVEQLVRDSAAESIASIEKGLESRVAGLTAAVESAQRVVSEETRGALAETLERISRERVKALKSVRWATFMTLVLSLGILGLAIVMLIMGR